MANRGLLQAAGSWSLDACCAVHGNDCHRNDPTWGPHCFDRTSSSDWLFGLWPGPPQRFEPTGTDTVYQVAAADRWPRWGSGDGGDSGDGGWGLSIGSGAPGGSDGRCDQGYTYRGMPGEICGGESNWVATDVEVWYPR